MWTSHSGWEIWFGFLTLTIGVIVEIDPYRLVANLSQPKLTRLTRGQSSQCRKSFGKEIMILGLYKSNLRFHPPPPHLPSFWPRFWHVLQIFTLGNWTSWSSRWRMWCISIEKPNYLLYTLERVRCEHSWGVHGWWHRWCFKVPKWPIVNNGMLSRHCGDAPVHWFICTLCNEMERHNSKLHKKYDKKYGHIYSVAHYIHQHAWK